MGRPAIFGSKDNGLRVQGVIGSHTVKDYSEARDRVAALAGCHRDRVSDGDVIAYLAMGHTKAAAYLKKHPFTAGGKK